MKAQSYTMKSDLLIHLMLTYTMQNCPKLPVKPFRADTPITLKVVK